MFNFSFIYMNLIEQIFTVCNIVNYQPKDENIIDKVEKGKWAPERPVGGNLWLYCWYHCHSSRNMHALGRLDLDCSLNIYVEFYKKLPVRGVLYSVYISNPNSCSEFDCNSDCVGWQILKYVVRRKFKHGAARSRARPSCCTSNTRWTF